MIKNDYLNFMKWFKDFLSIFVCHLYTRYFECFAKASMFKAGKDVNE